MTIPPAPEEQAGVDDADCVFPPRRKIAPFDADLRDGVPADTEVGVHKISVKSHFA
jgi:hypothetical protein